MSFSHPVDGKKGSAECSVGVWWIIAAWLNYKCRLVATGTDVEGMLSHSFLNHDKLISICWDTREIERSHG